MKGDLRSLLTLMQGFETRACKSSKATWPQPSSHSFIAMLHVIAARNPMLRLKQKGLVWNGKLECVYLGLESELVVDC